MKVKSGCVFVVGTLCLILTSIHAEMYTALVEMEELLETESVLINTLEGYVKTQQDKINHLRAKMREYQNEHTFASADITKYISNPINAYLLTKRLTTDWRKVENMMGYDAGSEFLSNITSYRKVLKFPSDEDLNGAAVALMRLQDIYQLDTSSLARGELNGVQYSTEMSSDDCFEVGRQSYINHDYYHTMLWMREAMRRLRAEPHNQSRSFNRADILDYMAFCLYKQGNIESALMITNELLKLVPEHKRAEGNKVYYEKELAKQKFEKRKKGDDDSDDTPLSDLPIAKIHADAQEAPERKKYKMLCRGDLRAMPSQLRALRCRYVTNGVAFLRLAPLKLEEAHLDPLIVVYHDVMYEREMEVVKRLARPRFRRATVHNAITGKHETANYRISKSAWLKTDDDAVIEQIEQRTADMTGLDMESAEQLQVVNYGIGGHYDPHFDFARRSEKKAFEGNDEGNRIATVLFYLSDVAQGGATVFPELRVALWPKKGTAAFWFNLHRSGEGDVRTRHAACPVLAGTKWVANIWIHERRQELRRPCDLQPDHREFAI